MADDQRHRRPRQARSEDQRFLTGTGRYTDDLQLARPDLRRLRALAARPRQDQAASTPRTAEAMPGVLAVFTGEDIADAKVGGLPCGWLVTDKRRPADEGAAAPGARAGQGALRRRPGRHGRRREPCRRPSDAAEPIEVDYEVLPAVVDIARGARKRRARRSTTRRRTTSAYDWAASATRPRSTPRSPRPPHVTKLDLVNNRLVPNADRAARRDRRATTRPTSSYTL